MADLFNLEGDIAYNKEFSSTPDRQESPIESKET